jgi:hypothetical protein
VYGLPYAADIKNVTNKSDLLMDVDACSHHLFLRQFLRVFDKSFLFRIGTRDSFPGGKAAGA